jgi:hypothetical protein
VVARLEHCEDSAGIAVLRFTHGAAVDENVAAVLVHPGFVRVAEAEHIASRRAPRCARRCGRVCPRTGIRSPCAGRCSLARAFEEDRRWFANWMRAGASPAVAYALNRALLETDLRDCCRTYSIREGTPRPGSCAGCSRRARSAPPQRAQSRRCATWCELLSRAPATLARDRSRFAAPSRSPLRTCAGTSRDGNDGTRTRDAQLQAANTPLLPATCS